MNDETLEPPQVLEPPRPVTAVAAEDAMGKVPLAADERSTIEGEAQRMAGDLATLEPESDNFRERVRALEALGNDEINRSASVANRMMDRPTRAMNALDGNSGVAKGMLDLRATIEKLDPSRQGDLFSPKKILGILPFGNKLRDYFRGYESSQTHLNAVIESLRRSKDELLRDNAAIEQEKANMWTLMHDLQKHALLARTLGDAVDTKVKALATSDPQRSKALAEEVLFAARQKQQDIATQLAVNVQGYLALDLIKKNNAELAKGVDRATTTTVAALRTAVVTAQALANQKLVLDQIAAVRDTTSNLIASTSRMLKENSVRVQEGATQSTVDVAKLSEAFANVRAAIDGMTDYRVKALASMEQTVDTLSTEVGKMTSYVEERRALTGS